MYIIWAVYTCTTHHLIEAYLSCHGVVWQEIQATWYEKLHDWEDALVAYDKKIDMNKDEDPELILGRMRCLEALGEWWVTAHCYSNLYK